MNVIDWQIQSWRWTLIRCPRRTPSTYLKLAKAHVVVKARLAAVAAVIDGSDD
jgi:hypothetical protein